MAILILSGTLTSCLDLRPGFPGINSNSSSPAKPAPASTAAPDDRGAPRARPSEPSPLPSENPVAAPSPKPDPAPQTLACVPDACQGAIKDLPSEALISQEIARLEKQAQFRVTVYEFLHAAPEGPGLAREAAQAAAEALFDEPKPPNSFVAYQQTFAFARDSATAHAGMGLEVREAIRLATQASHGARADLRAAVVIDGFKYAAYASDGLLLSPAEAERFIQALLQQPDPKVALQAHIEAFRYDCRDPRGPQNSEAHGKSYADRRACLSLADQGLDSARPLR